MVHRHQLDGGHAQREQVLEHGVHAETEIRSTQRFRHPGMALREPSQMALVDHGATPRRARRPVVAPAEGGFDDDALRHGSGAVAAAGRLVRCGIAGVVTEEVVAPADRAAERTRVGVDQELRRIESMSLRRRPWTVHPVAVELTRPDVGQIRVPDEAVALGQRDAGALASVGRLIEETEIHPGGVLREEREVHALAVPGGTQLVGIARPDAHPRLLAETRALKEARDTRRIRLCPGPPGSPSPPSSHRAS